MALRGGKLEKIIIITLLTCLPIFFMPEMAWMTLQQQEGDVLLEQGKQDYMEGRFEEAVEKLTLALKLLTDKDKLADVYLHLGLCHFALGERDKAKEDLSDLLKLNPAQRLDPLYYPPDFVNLLEEAKKAIIAQLKVETDPPIAQVFLDEELVGVTPLELTEVAAGEHKLKVIKQGYKTAEESLSLKVGEEKTVSITLEEEEKKPTVIVTDEEAKPEVKKKSNTLMWVLLGGAAAAAVLILAGRGGGGGDNGGPTPTPEPMLTIRIKATFEMSNMEAHWKIYIDDQVVFDEWFTVATRGGNNPNFGNRTRQFTIQRRPGSFNLKLHGVESRRIYSETMWIRSTKFEISIVGPSSEINRYRASPATFSLQVAPFQATRPEEWPRQRTQRISIVGAGASEALLSQSPVIIQSVEEKKPD